MDGDLGRLRPGPRALLKRVFHILSETGRPGRPTPRTYWVWYSPTAIYFRDSPFEPHGVPRDLGQTATRSSADETCRFCSARFTRKQEVMFR